MRFHIAVAVTVALFLVNAMCAPTSSSDGSVKGKIAIVSPVATYVSPFGTQTIELYSDGTADQAEILLQDREGFRLGLRINPITARVQIIELGRR